MSDAKNKRYAREVSLLRGEKIYVKATKDSKGKQMDCKKVANEIIEKDLGKKKELLEQYLKDNYFDVKLFGIVGTTEPKFNITGPVQVMWSRSVHEAEIKFAQGTSSFSSGENKTQGTTWAKYFTPYALFKTYMVYNNESAKRQGINISDDDIELFKDVLISGIRSYKSTSKNQMPRLLVEVVYKEHFIDGELDYLNVNYEKEDLSLRCIEDFTFDLQGFATFMETRKSKIEKVNVYTHQKVNLINVPADINILPL